MLSSSNDSVDLVLEARLWKIITKQIVRLRSFHLTCVCVSVLRAALGVPVDRYDVEIRSDKKRQQIWLSRHFLDTIFHMMFVVDKKNSNIWMIFVFINPHIFDQPTWYLRIYNLYNCLHTAAWYRRIIKKSIDTDKGGAENRAQPRRFWKSKLWRYAPPPRSGEKLSLWIYFACNFFWHVRFACSTYLASARLLPPNKQVL